MKATHLMRPPTLTRVPGSIADLEASGSQEAPLGDSVLDWEELALPLRRATLDASPVRDGVLSDPDVGTRTGFGYVGGALSERKSEVTRILQEAGADVDRRDELLPHVYEELRSIAQRRMGSERKDHTLQATALVHEAYLRLLSDEPADWESRRHFYGAASEAMRRILIDHARRVGSQKRGGDRMRLTLGPDEFVSELDADQFLALDEALTKLELEDPRAASVTKLRYYSGLSVEETAQVLEVSERTVHREWRFARARLFELMEAESER